MRDSFYNYCIANNKTLLEEWDYEKNSQIDFTAIGHCSSKKVWWKCKNGHNWEAMISNRSKGRNCPFCSSQRVLAGYNDLATKKPDIVKLWNYRRNTTLQPSEVTAFSNKKVWWICPKGHEWNSTVNKVSTSGGSCPICSHQILGVGYSDLATVYPRLAKEWHPVKNNGLTPQDVFAKSNKKAWWICEKGHEWEAQISGRAKGGGCPICNGEYKTSFAEQAIAFYCGQVTKSENRVRIQRKEIDIYLPELSVGIEHNGLYWHRNTSERDLKKKLFFEELGIHVICVNESKKEAVEGEDIYYIATKKESLGWAIERMFEILGLTAPDIDIKRDEGVIHESYIFNEERKSLAILCPELAQQWHPHKNGRLTPKMVAENSNKIIWWECGNGHEWKASVVNRRKGRGCPYCSNKRIKSGENDLATLFPELIPEWNYFKNDGVDPTKISSGSSKRVWWKCKDCGNEWATAVSNRTNNSNKNGCPKCAILRRVESRNENIVDKRGDLAEHNPELLEEWDYDLNGEITPNNVTASSNKIVWWKCRRCGFSYKKSVNSKILGKSCPNCKEDGLLYTYPEILVEWDYNKNNVNPMNVSSSSGVKVWWLCKKCGNSYLQGVKCHINGSTCPLCAYINGAAKRNKTRLARRGTLLDNNPEVCKEWDYAKNTIKPNEVTWKSGIKVWWICSNGHSWYAKISDRCVGQKCPVCSRKSAGLKKRKDTQILEWRRNHPNGKPGECQKDTGFSTSTIYKWWNRSDS